MKAAEDRRYARSRPCRRKPARRSWPTGDAPQSFQSELTAACDGFTGADVNAWLWAVWHSAGVGDVTIERPAELAVVAPLRKRRNLAAEEFTFLHGCTSRQAKVTLPSPSLLANLRSPRHSVAAYPTLDGFLADVVQVLCEEVREPMRKGYW